MICLSCIHNIHRVVEGYSLEKKDSCELDGYSGDVQECSKYCERVALDKAMKEIFGERPKRGRPRKVK